jgi:methionyl-tRNA formyltransferase
MTSAVVFAYHDVGVRCLQTLLSHGVKVRLVVTHEDAPTENIWFESVAALARRHAIATVAPADPNTLELSRQLAALQPDLLFSFYYRHMLRKPLLDIPRLGALNIHGSLLPKYRGRAPVNWAVINGERETGATLHYMAEKPDAGDIVDREAIPIWPDDTAAEVFRRMTGAAQAMLGRNLQRLIDGTALRLAQNPAQATYFGGRKPEDGRIDWARPAAAIHNLVRGVAPPYPGAFTCLDGKPARVLRTLREPGASGPYRRPFLFFVRDRCYAQCGDAALLRIAHLDMAGELLQEPDIARVVGDRPLPLPIATRENA